jgi:shikimate kinase
VTAPRQIHNLALVGFMGAGKSSVGRFVAEQLRFDIVDTDDLIEARAGKRISEIFADSGEAHFREVERLIVHELAGRRRLVISAGGGLIVHPDNLADLKQHALVVCLWAKPDVLWQRIRHQSHRPLLDHPNPFARICELLAEREPFYRQADVLLNTERRSVREVGLQAIHQFRTVLSKQA